MGPVSFHVLELGALTSGFETRGTCQNRISLADCKADSRDKFKTNSNVQRVTFFLSAAMGGKEVFALGRSCWGFTQLTVPAGPTQTSDVHRLERVPYCDNCATPTLDTDIEHRGKAKLKSKVGRPVSVPSSAALAVSAGYTVKYIPFVVCCFL